MWPKRILASRIAANPQAVRNICAKARKLQMYQDVSTVELRIQSSTPSFLAYTKVNWWNFQRLQITVLLV